MEPSEQRPVPLTMNAAQHLAHRAVRGERTTFSALRVAEGRAAGGGGFAATGGKEGGKSFGKIVTGRTAVVAARQPSTRFQKSAHVFPGQAVLPTGTVRDRAHLSVPPYWSTVGDLAGIPGPDSGNPGHLVACPYHARRSFLAFWPVP